MLDQGNQSKPFPIFETLQVLTFKVSLPSDWYLDEVLLLAMPEKDGWGGLADGPRVREAVVSQ